MTCNSAITLYQYSDEAEKYQRTVINSAYIYEETAAKSDSNVNGGGRADSSAIKIRIPTNSDYKIKIGDRVVVGICAQTSPPRDTYYRIMKIFDRRVGKNPHWRLECE